MANHPPLYRSRRPSAGALAGSLLLVALTASPASDSAQTTLFRCTNAAGEIEYRQTGCEAGSNGQSVTVEDRHTGWVPPQPDSAPGTEPKIQPESGNAGKERARREAADAAQADRCWKKQRQLDEVSARLRHGYGPAEGVRLHNRQRSYEDYIDRFCRQFR